MKTKSSILSALAFSLLLGLAALLCVPPSSAETLNTPIYSNSEKELGEYWLRSFRGSVRTSTNPLISDYIDELINNLARYTSVNFGDISTVLVDSPDINAFAVPGSIIGVNLGIFKAASNEGQLASILAHELAHLSQRHFARSMQERQSQQMPVYAGLLLGAVLAAAGSGDGASAAIAGSQAAAAQAQLRFSRQFEQEADRVGVVNLAKAGYSKNDMVDMFEILSSQFGTRFGSEPPEYLLTHPLPSSRINEIRRRVLSDKRPEQNKDSLQYHLIKVLVDMRYARRAAGLSKDYKAQLSRIKRKDYNTREAQILRYGLANAYMTEGKQALAIKGLQSLLAINPSEISYHYSLLSAYNQQDSYKSVLAHIKKNPQIKTAYPIAMIQIEALNGSQQHAAAQQIIFEQLQERKDSPLLWYLLAETSGQLQDIGQLHEARAEYFILHNRLDKAQEQLNYALKDKRVKLSSARKAALEHRMTYIKSVRKRGAELGF